MKKMNKYLLFIGLIMFACVVNVSAANRLSHGDESDAKEQLKDEHGAEVGKYCHYSENGAESEWHDVVIAVSKDGRFAGVDSRNVEFSSNSWHDYLKNWDSSKGCTRTAIVEVSTEKGLVLDHYIQNVYLYDYPPEAYIKNSKYHIFYLEEAPANATKTCTYSIAKITGEKGRILTLYLNDQNAIVDRSGAAFEVMQSDEYSLNAAFFGSECPSIYICNGPVHFWVYISDYTSDDNGFTSDKCEFSKCTNTFKDYCNPDSRDNLVCPQYTYITERTDGEERTKELTAYCTNAISKLDYANPCTRKCMNFFEDIKKPVDATDGECGFSNKMVIWIMNILRWVKYIIPVLLIVLSILDFIKAMAGEKDDDLKKAQKHFVTRLIVAVLIFIMPLIIEFVLNKMGFSAEDCGIKNIGLGK